MPQARDGAVQLLCRRLGIADEAALPAYARGRFARELAPLLASPLLRADDPYAFKIAEDIALGEKYLSFAHGLDEAATQIRTEAEAAGAAARALQGRTAAMDARQAALDAREGRLAAAEAALQDRSGGVLARLAGALGLSSAPTAGGGSQSPPPQAPARRPPAGTGTAGGRAGGNQVPQGTGRQQERRNQQ